MNKRFDKKLIEIYNLIKKENITLDKRERNTIRDEIINGIDKNMFANTLRAVIGKNMVGSTGIQREAIEAINNVISIGVNENGGYLVPEDIKTEVKQLRKQGLSLENLVNVEPVNTDKGNRTYEIGADQTPLTTTVEGEDIEEVTPNSLINIKFNVIKKACIVNITNGLFEDSNGAITSWLEKWSSKKARATRNQMIIDKVNEITFGSEIAATDVSTLRSAILTNLGDQYKESATVLVNYSGYDYLNILVDTNGDKILKDKILFGLYPVEILPDNLLANGTGTISIVIGSLKEAIGLYDREKSIINIAEISVYQRTYISLRYIEKLDVKMIDSDAIIKVLLTK